MVFSQDIINALDILDTYKQEIDFRFSLELKKIAQEAKEEQDRHIIDIIYGSLSMGYVLDERKFKPRISFPDGRRSFAMEDISEEDLSILKCALNIIKVEWMRGKLAHIIWVVSNDYKYANIAVSEYINLFKQEFHPENWVECYNMIELADTIASGLGKANACKKEVYDTIIQALIQLDGEDPLFLSLQLIKLIYKDARNDDLNIIWQIINKLVDKNINIQNSNWSLVDETYEVLELVLKRCKLHDKLETYKRKYAEYYVECVNNLVDKGDEFRAIMLLKKSCSLYMGLDSRRLQELRIELEKLQQKSLKQMSPVSIPINTTHYKEIVERLFDGLTLQESIIQLGRIAQIYKIEEVKQKLKEEQEKYLFKSLFRTGQLNEKGQTVQELPPLNDDIFELDSKSEQLFKHMVHYVAEQRDYNERIFLTIAFSHIQKLGIGSAEDLNFLVENNSIIPNNRTAILKEGLFIGLSGNLYAAIHILLPQTENIFRYLVAMCGDTTTFLSSDGTESAKPLSALFKSEKLLECYSEDIIFTFQSIMDVPIGENLRNLTAHGLLEPHYGNISKSLCFLCLLIKLLSWYKRETQSISAMLSERDSQIFEKEIEEEK